MKLSQSSEERVLIYADECAQASFSLSRHLTILVTPAQSALREATGFNMNKRRNVAIVDDDVAHRLAVGDLILSLGWDVLLFASPEEYLQSGYLGETSFLISDVRMPGMSGIEMHKRLLGMGFTPPTIFITGFSTAVLEAEVLASGALALLEKPFDSAVIALWLNFSLDQP